MGQEKEAGEPEVMVDARLRWEAGQCFYRTVAASERDLTCCCMEEQVGS